MRDCVMQSQMTVDDDDPEVLERHQDDNAWEEAAAAENKTTFEEMKTWKKLFDKIERRGGD